MTVCEHIPILEFWKICGKLCEAESRHAKHFAAPLKKTAIPGWKWDTKLLYIAVPSEPHPLILVQHFQHGTTALLAFQCDRISDGIVLASCFAGRTNKS